MSSTTASGEPGTRHAFTGLGYAPPYTYEEVVANYGKALADKLLKDPVHSWRMETGVELIHDEPSLDEQRRIWENWQRMSPDMKLASDKRSVELFGVTNQEHHMRIMAARRHGIGELHGPRQIGGAPHQAPKTRTVMPYTEALARYRQTNLAPSPVGATSRLLPILLRALDN